MSEEIKRLNRYTDNGRPGYDPWDMFKLCMYGYLNRIRTSRLLERECGRNIKLMWLLKGHIGSIESGNTLLQVSQYHSLSTPSRPNKYFLEENCTIGNTKKIVRTSGQTIFDEIVSVRKCFEPVCSQD